MRFHIENLGPIRSADLEIGDITVVFGPPNTGKSYTLRALYASTLMLDQYAREFELRDLIGTYDAVNLPLNLRGSLRALYVLLVLHALGHERLDDQELNLTEILKELTGAESVRWSFQNGTLNFTARASSDIPVDSLLAPTMDFYRDIVLVRDDSELDSSVSVPELLDLIAEISAEPRRYVKNFADSRRIASCKVNVSFSMRPEGIVAVALELTFSMRADGKAAEKILSKRAMEIFKEIAPSAENLKATVSEIVHRAGRPGHVLGSILPYSIELWLNNMFWRFIDESICQPLAAAHAESYGLEEVRFIPFGRSIAINQLELLSQEPIRRHRLAYGMVYESDVVLHSYISWLSLGRSMIAEGSYDDEAVELFLPVLQGRLLYERSRGLSYFTGACTVPINAASALAGEVAGILLPVLSTRPRSRIIIEEPEAQLHYSAQLLMGLTLAALASKYGHEVIFSTHSDLVVLILAYIKTHRPSGKKIRELVEKLLEVQRLPVEGDSLELLSEYAARAGDLDIRFYYYGPEQDGVQVSEVPVDALTRHIPSLTDVIDILLEWAIGLGDDSDAEDDEQAENGSRV